MTLQPPWIGYIAFIVFCFVLFSCVDKYVARDGERYNLGGYIYMYRGANTFLHFLGGGKRLKIGV